MEEGAGIVHFVVQSLSHVWLSVIAWTVACQAPFPPLSPRVCSNSYLLSPWCHPTTSSSVAPFFFHPQSFPASESFPMSQLFASGGQSIGASLSASILLMSTQVWFPLRLTGLICLLSKGLSRVFSSIIVWKHQFFGALLVYGPALITIHNYWKDHSLCIQTFVSKVMSLFFNTLSRFVIAFLLRSNCLLISWLQSPPAVILEPKKRKSVTASTFSPIYLHEVMDQMPWS